VNERLPEPPPPEIVRHIKLNNLAKVIGKKYADLIFDVIRHEHNIYSFVVEIQRLDVLVNLAYGFKVSGPKLLKIAKDGLESIVLQELHATLRPTEGGTPYP